MIRKSPTNPARAGVTRRRFAAGAGAAGLLAGTAPFNIVRAQGGPLKIGVILPLSVVVGAAFLVLADVLARTLLSPAELPIGVVTAFIGAPFFALVLRTTRSSA